MKKDLSTGTIIAVAVGVAAVLGVVGFFVFNSGPAHHPSTNPKDKIPAAPQAGPPPDWFVKKLHDNEAKSR